MCICPKLCICPKMCICPKICVCPKICICPKMCISVPKCSFVPFLHICMPCVCFHQIPQILIIPSKGCVTNDQQSSAKYQNNQKTNTKAKQKIGRLFQFSREIKVNSFSLSVKNYEKQENRDFYVRT